MQMPNITPAQVKADVIFVVGISSALGIHFSDQAALSDSLTGIIVGALAVAKGVAYIADAIIRHGRSRVVSSPQALAMLEQPKPPVIGG